MTANDRPTMPAPATLTIPAPPPAELLVECIRPDLRLPSDALAQAALAVVRDAVVAGARDAVEFEVDALFAEADS